MSQMFFKCFIEILKYEIFYIIKVIMRTVNYSNEFVMLFLLYEDMVNTDIQLSLSPNLNNPLQYYFQFTVLLVRSFSLNLVENCPLKYP